MDNVNICIQPTPKDNGFSVMPWILRIAATLLAVACTVVALWSLSAPSEGIDFSSLASPEEINEGEVYLMKDMLSAGIFMYMGDSEQKGVARKSEKGIFLEKEYVYSYHTLAMADCGDGKCLMIFSVKNTDGYIFDTVATHDKAENEKGDPGDSFPVSVYVKAKALGGDTTDTFTKSKEEHKGVVGLEKVSWTYFEMEYICDADESLVDAIRGEKHDWLMTSLYAIPVVILLFGLSFIKVNKKEEED